VLVYQKLTLLVVYVCYNLHAVDDSTDYLLIADGVRTRSR